MMTMDAAEFQTPQDCYRGLDLWMVNDHLEDDELVHQVHEFREKGLYSVIFRTYNGLFSDYPGPEFRHKVRVAVNAARDCGLKIVLQAGYMPSAFPDLPPAYMLHHISPTPEDQLTGNETVLLRRNGIAYVDALSPAAINMLDEESTRYYIRKTYEEMWADFRDEFGKTIISVWVDEPRFNNRYMVWTPSMEADYRAKYGESLTDQLNALYEDVGDYRKIRYRYFTMLRDKMETHYFTTVRDWCHRNGLTFSGHLMGEELLKYQTSQGCALMPFYKYFDIPGIDMLRAHHEWGDHALSAPAVTMEGMIVSTVQCVSAALQAGKAHILCEMYGVTSPGFSFRDAMHLFDFFAANGINHQCMHALFYSIGGFRKRFYPQQFNVYQPFWPNFRALKDYVARVGQFVSTGESTVDTVLIHPLETAYMKMRGLKRSDDLSPRDAIDAYDRAFDRTVIELYSAHIPFHFGDQATIEQDGCVRDGCFVIGQMAYRRVVLPELQVLNCRTWTLLQEFARAGGEIIVLGAFPDRLDGEADERLPEEMRALPNLTQVPDAETLTRLLRQIDLGYRYTTEDDFGDTIVHHNRADRTHYFMIYSGSCRLTQRGKLRIPGRFCAECMNAETGDIYPIPCSYEKGETVVPVRIAPGGSVLLRLTAIAELPAVPTKRLTVSMPLPPFSCTPEHPNVLTLETCAYKTADMTDFSVEYAVECVTELLKKQAYSGIVTLRFRFFADEPLCGLQLAVEEPESCEITLNGTPVDARDTGYYFARSFRLLTLPDCVHAGENILEITRETKPQIQEQITDDMKHLFELFRAPVGVDLERVHIIGDFTVDTVAQCTRGGMTRCANHFRLTAPQPVIAATNMTAHGYPFYIGSMVFTTEFTLESPLPDAMLQIGEFNGCTAQVTVNGVRVGSLSRAPYTIAVGTALKPGTNRIDLRLYGTLRNAIGPSHLNGVDSCGCHRGIWPNPLLPASCETEERTGDFELIPFGVGDAELMWTLPSDER